MSHNINKEEKMHSFAIKRYVKSCIGRIFKKMMSKGLYPNLKIILMYHRLSDDLKAEIYDHAMYVKAKTFLLHINEIKKHMNIVQLEDIVNEENTKRRLCAVTFDDGWLDNYSVAFPILKKNSVPATIFVCANMIGTKDKFWFDRLNDCFNKAVNNNKEHELIEFLRKVIPLRGAKTIDESKLSEIYQHFKQINPTKIEKIINDACNNMNIENQNERSLLNWIEIDEMGNDGISFGSHGVAHEILTKLPFEEQKKSIAQSYKTLRDSINNFVPFFSYPNGDWNNDSLNLVKSTGYSGAVTTKLGTNNTIQNRFILNRIAIHEDISDTSELLWFRILQAIKAHGIQRSA